MNQYKVRQRRGEVLLRAADPTWYLHVDADLLDQRTRTWCVLGQWAGTYEAGCARLSVPRPNKAISFLVQERDETEPAVHGFNLPNGEGNSVQWYLLNRAWKRRVRYLQRNGDVGEPLRRVTIEPLPASEPVEEPTVTPAEPERVPA